MSSTTTKGVATRAFRDAGKAQVFQKGEVYDFDAGSFANYVVAGLVRDPDGNEARRNTAEPLTLTEADQVAATNDTQPSG
jgi:hypothetical protein